MGVHGLWELLSPVGRRVSVETLAGKRLAIDASIWMVQFMKAMRDERGEIVRNAHLLGFFRRICKLLYLRTKPVFVFDGGTPALKRRTLIARRRQRDNAQAKVRKTAEKLLLNHLRAIKLREIAKDLESQKQKQKQQDAKKRRILPEQPEIFACSSQMKEAMEKRSSQDKQDEMMRIFTEAEKEKILRDDALASAASSPCEADSGKDEDANIILQSIDGEVDPDVLAALPLLVQRKLVQKYKSDAKGKKVFSDPTIVGNDSERSTENSRNTCQENLDEILAASLMAEEEANITANVLGTADINLDIEDRDDEDEEMIIPELHGEVDPSILASLPPSMQLDLLVQMREKLMAENRQKYKKVKKDPAKFSELQIQAYLKTVAFRREINEVQKAASGSGVAGVQTSRIASEANREFIFSSSFTGDKKELAHGRAQRNGNNLQQAPRQVSNSLNKSKSLQSNTINGSTSDKPTSSFDDTETYLDEMGRVRVSRVRGMGMRMTRDLQRNLDLMKEIENESNNGKTIANSESTKNLEIGGPESFASENQSTEISFEGSSKFGTLNDGTGKGVDCSVSTKKTKIDGLESFSSEKQFAEVVHEGIIEFENLNDEVRQTMVKHDTPIEISFEGNGEKFFDGDDDLFASLVSENPVKNPTLLHSLSRTKSSDFFLDFEREDGIIGPGNLKLGSDPKFEIRSNSREGNISDDSEIDWEEGEINTTSFLKESTKAISKGSLEEEADWQEAVRRSLEDFDVVSENDNPKGLIGNESEDIAVLALNANIDRLEQPYTVNETDHAQTINAFPGDNGDSESEKRHQNEEPQCQEYLSTLATNKIHLVAEQPLDKDCQLSSFLNKGLGENFYTSGSNRQEYGNTHFEDKCDHSVARTNAVILQVESLPQKFADDTCVEENLPAENIRYDNTQSNKENDFDKSTREEFDEAEVYITEAKLEEEIVFLDQERLNLGNEQRKFERDAESVSTEMFVECQELLQMFGLPYIISPMEAEAQCAYMELENLVDGVVTDDSDVFLFGARSVYKNIFDDRKYVETYLMKDIENELGLAREKLIRMALLLGSDYTEGVSGIGIVNAIEVVNAFPEEDGLHKFREWIESPDPTILGKLGAPKESSQRKRGSKAGELAILDSNSNGAEDSAAEQNHLGAQNHDQSADLSKDKQNFMDKHRNVSKNWHIPSSFPSSEVFSAYLNPQVDKSTEPFSWGKPDHLFLRKLCWEKFGWDNKKADELVLPVLKEYSKHETQLRMEAFYTFNERFAKIRSKRIKKAVKGITGNSSTLLMNDVMQDASKTRKKKTANPIETEGGGLKEFDSVENASPKARRRRPGKAVKVSVKDPKLPMQEDSNRSMIRKRAQGNERSTGKRERKTGAGRRVREVGSSSTESAGASSSYGEDEPQDIRRSTRQKKPVNYTEADNDMDQPVDQKDERPSYKEARKVEASNDPFQREDALAGGDNHKEHNLECPSLEETSGRDDLESGLFPIEDENQQQQAGFHEYYLKMGGGFCMDEDDNARINEDDSGQERVPMAANLDVASVDEGICKVSVDESGKADETMGGNVELEFDSGRALKAMPYLRRKRRK